jgi:hypothetical protein
MKRTFFTAKLLSLAIVASLFSPAVVLAEEESLSLSGPEIPAAVGVDQPGLNLTESDCGGDGDQGTRTPVPEEHETLEDPDASLTPAPPEETAPSHEPLSAELLQVRGKLRAGAWQTPLSITNVSAPLAQHARS